MGRQKLTTDQVEAYYRTHPADHKGPPVPLWLRVVLIGAGVVMVLGVILAFA
jgi:hypothetical protein